jgi:hypothetical protein
MCWEETEETVIHEDISQWGTTEGKTNTFCLWGWLYIERFKHPTSAWRDLLERSISPSAGDNKQKIHGKKCNMNI